MMASRALVRRLHVTTAPVVSSSVSARSTPQEAVPPLPVLSTVDQVRLQAIGQPPSAVSISVPPSVPVHVRRNTLLSVHGTWQSIVSLSVAPDWVKRCIHGLSVMRYQRLVATQPFSLLVTANTPTLLPALVHNITPKSLALVSVDGLSDWAILKRDAVHVYAGPALSMGVYSVPRRILRRLARNLGLTRLATGLSRWGYTFVSGRGVLGLAGHGQLYTATVGDGEELLVSRRSLVAVLVNGPYDLQNCVVQHSYKQPVSPPSRTPVNTWKDIVGNARYYWWKVRRLFSSDGSDLVRVFGPRTILLQSGNPHQTFVRNVSENTAAGTSVMPSVAMPDSTRSPNSADYLNVVTFDQSGTPSITSTPDFGDAVRAIQKKN